MAEYWLISAPGEKTCAQTWETLNNVTSRQNNLSTNYRFPIPDLKVGTLDQLVGLSDDLGKLDSYVESITRKIAGYLGEVLEEQKDKLAENLLANGCKSRKFDLATYITRYQWELAKYPIKQSLRSIADTISKLVSQIDTDLKMKATAYNNIKSSLQSMERKQTGSLLTRNLEDLVKKENFVLDSEYLTTLVVVVPKASYSEWQTAYEKLTDMVVPRSSQLIYEDNENGLFTVTLFQKIAKDFKDRAREHKFIVREFEYNEEKLAAGKNEISKLASDKKKQFGPLVRWLKVNFSEAFTAWIHVKALRVFVESVLRYGLPVNFQAMLLHPNKKSIKKLREVINQLYSHLDTSAGQGSADVAMDIPGLALGQQEYYPYVYYKINIDMITIGIIVGSGLDDPDILENRKEIVVTTPFGNTSDALIEGTIKGVACVLLARHGRGSTITPTNVNYRANIWALKDRGCTHLIVSTACGSLDENIHPGDIVFLDQFIDRTTKRPNTFYDGAPNSPNGVCHVPMHTPFCPSTTKILIDSAVELGVKHHVSGTVITNEGPRFSTRGESKLFRTWGAHVINMTSVPEVTIFI
uniref:V-type proton ATPase subunit C n=1 Tax=Strigamia maritima TaxID=126957 RepID=T1J1L0_STRMM